MKLLLVLVALIGCAVALPQFYQSMDIFDSSRVVGGRKFVV